MYIITQQNFLGDFVYAIKYRISFCRSKVFQVVFRQNIPMSVEKAVLKNRLHYTFTSKSVKNSAYLHSLYNLMF